MPEKNQQEPAKEVPGPHNKKNQAKKARKRWAKEQKKAAEQWGAKGQWWQQKEAQTKGHGGWAPRSRGQGQRVVKVGGKGRGRGAANAAKAKVERPKGLRLEERLQEVKYEETTLGFDRRALALDQTEMELQKKRRQLEREARDAKEHSGSKSRRRW